MSESKNRNLAFGLGLGFAMFSLSDWLTDGLGTSESVSNFWVISGGFLLLVLGGTMYFDPQRSIGRLLLLIALSAGALSPYRLLHDRFEPGHEWAEWVWLVRPSMGAIGAVVVVWCYFLIISALGKRGAIGTRPGR